MPIPSIAGDIPLDQAGTINGPSPGVAPPTSFFERVKLGYKSDQARPTWGFNETNWKNGAIAEVNDALRAHGVQPVVNLMDTGDWMRAMPIQRGESYEGWQNRLYGAVLGQVAQLRANDPKILPDFLPVVDKRSFDEMVAGRQRKQFDDVQQQAPDGLGVAGFLGGLAHGSLDPINYLPIGGEASVATSVSRRILQNGLRWGATNVAITAATEPLVRHNAERLGIDRTNTDFAMDLLGAGTLGFALGGPGAEVARFGRGTLVGALQRRAERRAAATGTPFDSFDADVAKTFADIVPPEQRTPDEQAAIHAIERDAEVKAVSPFVPGPEGDDAHAAHLDRAMQALHEPDKLPQRGPVKPVARETVAGPDDVAGARMPGRELLKAKIHQVEAPHGGPNLAGGNAFGPYQFEPRTWVNLFKRRYPKDARSFDEIAGLRGDPHLNDVLMNDLISENAAALRHAGFDESAGNLYLAHVLGHDRAVRVLSADPNARLGDLLPEGYFKGNPFRPNDTASSLIHWSYGKMGDKGGLPVHLASDEAAQGAEAISAGEGDPQVQPSTGRFDVEALYGDVGMTDRAVLNPDHFVSPEEHAAAQVRFERTSDAADGFAPVMSRAEAFSPDEHFGAIRGYKGKVTTEAMAEALGLTPGELRTAVGKMQGIDANSPFVLTRGRQPKYDKLGNVTREGTEAGRVIRRPPRTVKQNETMLEFLTRTNGGLKDINPSTGKGGDLASMGGQHWHQGAPFRRQLIDNEGGQSLDDAFGRAMEAGYFPEHTASRLGGGGYDDLPDPQDFLDAIDDELRGKPRYAIEDVVSAHEAARRALVDPEQEAAFHAALERRLFPPKMTAEEIESHVPYGDYEQALARADDLGLTPVDDGVLVEAAQRWAEGQPLDEAIEHAVMSAAARDLEDFAALAGEMGYEPSNDAAAFIGEHAEIRDAGGPGGENGAGGGRSAAAAAGAEESRAQLAASAHDPAAGHFSDPVGQATEAQADSTIHDLQMEPPTEGDASTYRLDEDGGESDLASILDEIEQAQKAATEMRNCLKPKGGDE